MTDRIKELEDLIKDHAIAKKLSRSEIMTALTVTIYQIALVGAATDDCDPNDLLTSYIEVLEEGWGSYTKHHAKGIALMNAMARKRP